MDEEMAASRLPLNGATKEDAIDANSAMSGTYNQKQIGQFLTSNDQTWMTPPEFMDSLRGEFNFVLDVAASAKSAQAAKFYTEETDAFKQDWIKDSQGGAAWANPPYSDHRKPLPEWILRGWYFRRRVTSVWLLPANKTDQPFWHELVIPYAQVRDVWGRINFLDPETGKVPLTWKVDKKTGIGKWVRNGNSQASKLVVFGPGYGSGPLISHRWKKDKKSRTDSE